MMADAAPSIRCSGIHRGIGTHITKVKSTTLDTWPEPMVAKFHAMGGNVRVNAVYEARLPQGFRRPSPDENHAMVRFIRAKYEHKEYYSAAAAKAAVRCGALPGQAPLSRLTPPARRPPRPRRRPPWPPRPRRAP